MKSINGEYHPFYWRLHKDSQSGVECIILGFSGKQPDQSIEAWVLPSKGCNLARLLIGNRALIDMNVSRLKEDWFLGNAILYPTPNRVFEGILHYKDKTLTLSKRGKRIPMHGLVFNEPWEWEQPRITSEGVLLNTWIDFNEEKDYYEAFPFIHRLSLSFILSRKGVKVAYTVSNQGEEELPFGFALHPFFKKLDDQTLLLVPAQTMMECRPDYIPTGCLKRVDGTDYDLRKPMPLTSRYYIDNEYYPLIGMAEIHYPSLRRKLVLETSPEFSHCVVYTPDKFSFFCIENQTCAIDAHNLYDRGFQEESGLIVLPPGESHSGFVSYHVEDL